MKAHGHCTSGDCLGASANGATVSLYVEHTPPLLRLQRALPVGTPSTYESMRRHGRQAGTNTEARPGVAWDMLWYVPLVVLMLVKNLNAHAMESYLAEDGQLWIQQAQGMSVADAGDGRSPVYPLRQSAHTDAGSRTGRQVRRHGIGAGKTATAGPVERQEGSQEAPLYPQRSFATRSR